VISSDVTSESVHKLILTPEYIRKFEQIDRIFFFKNSESVAIQIRTGIFMMLSINSEMALEDILNTIRAGTIPHIIESKPEDVSVRLDVAKHMIRCIDKKI
jgi:hypothetical protein